MIQAAQPRCFMQRRVTSWLRVAQSRCAVPGQIRSHVHAPRVNPHPTASRNSIRLHNSSPGKFERPTASRHGFAFPNFNVREQSARQARKIG